MHCKHVTGRTQPRTLALAAIHTRTHPHNRELPEAHHAPSGTLHAGGSNTQGKLFSEGGHAATNPSARRGSKAALSLGSEKLWAPSCWATAQGGAKQSSAGTRRLRAEGAAAGRQSAHPLLAHARGVGAAVHVAPLGVALAGLRMERGSGGGCQDPSKCVCARLRVYVCVRVRMCVSASTSMVRASVRVHICARKKKYVHGVCVCVHVCLWPTKDHRKRAS